MKIFFLKVSGGGVQGSGFTYESLGLGWGAASEREGEGFSSAPSAQLIGNSSRRGAEDANERRGKREERKSKNEEVRLS